MSQAATLLAAAQTFHAGQFPATIKLGDQSYDASTSGLRAQSALEPGGFTAQRACSFWLPAAAFAVAGEPLPKETDALICTAPAALAGSYLIEAVLSDGTAATITLRCTAPPQ